MKMRRLLLCPSILVFGSAAYGADPFWVVKPGEAYECRVTADLDGTKPRIAASYAGRTVSSVPVALLAKLRKGLDGEVACSEDATLFTLSEGGQMVYFFYKNREVSLEGYRPSGPYGGALASIHSAPFFATILPFKTDQHATIQPKEVILTQKPDGASIQKALAERNFIDGFVTSVTGSGNQYGMLRVGYLAREAAGEAVYEGVPTEFMLRGIWKTDDSFELEMFDSYGGVQPNGVRAKKTKVGVVSYTGWKELSKPTFEVKPPFDGDADISFRDGTKVVGLRWMHPKGKLLEQLGRQNLINDRIAKRAEVQKKDDTYMGRVVGIFIFLLVLVGGLSMAFKRKNR